MISHSIYNNNVIKFSEKSNRKNCTYADGFNFLFYNCLGNDTDDSDARNYCSNA